MVGGDQPHAEGRDGAQPAHRRLRRGRRRRQPATRRCAHVPGKGGVFKVTHGLQRLYGDDRVFNSPLAEANIVGRAVGMATRGLKPVVEIQFFDYIWPAMMQLSDEMSMLRYRSGNNWSCPMVVRVPIGGYLRGGAPYHSQSGVSIFAHCPGIRIAFPSQRRSTRPACCARRSAATTRCCSSSTSTSTARPTTRAPYPGRRLHDPVRQGRRCAATAPTWSCSRGARSCSARCSPRSRPRRTASASRCSTCARSCRTTGTASPRSSRRPTASIIAHEDQLTCGFGAEIAARIGDELFEYLDAPVKRVAALDCPVAYCPDLEEAILPQSCDVLTGDPGARRIPSRGENEERPRQNARIDERHRHPMRVTLGPIVVDHSMPAGPAFAQRSPRSASVCAHRPGPAPWRLETLRAAGGLPPDICNSFASRSASSRPHRASTTSSTGAATPSTASIRTARGVRKVVQIGGEDGRLIEPTAFDVAPDGTLRRRRRAERPRAAADLRRRRHWLGGFMLPGRAQTRVTFRRWRSAASARWRSSAARRC